MRPEPLEPGATIGILGGGQLGRFLAIAASKLGFKTAIYCPEADSPAFHVASRFWQRPYDDTPALTEFAKACDAIAFEFENVPAAALALAQRFAPVRPNPRAAEIAQDRIAEKRFLAGIGLPAAPYAVVEGDGDLPAAAEFLAKTGAGILKRAREGYDGKGQARVFSGAELRAAYAGFAAPCVLEAVAGFSLEISVVAVCSGDGGLSCYDAPENKHDGGILRTSAVPASCSGTHKNLAREMTGRIGAALDYRGVLSVEFFVMPDSAPEPLLVNEIAPRVHNSGHWTMEACAISQFENHIRAIAGWPIGSVERHSDAVMTNLIGEDALGWRAILEKDPGASLYLYGKNAIREGRKLGHVTQISPRK
ncbi:MAG: 5-(carboxyamino)imidazole ribonucleotide synthase [Rhodomicrobium sp.]